MSLSKQSEVHKSELVETKLREFRALAQMNKEIHSKVYLKEKIKSDFVIGKSPKMGEIMDLVHKVTPTSTTVIIYGETGTGKELMANAIHEMGPRKDAPLIKVNCAAILDDLLESELFGHETLFSNYPIILRY